MRRQSQRGASLGRQAADASTDIYIADTIGELGLFYNLVPVAFVGGSLVPHGGQNPVEAIKLGAAVVTGRIGGTSPTPMRSSGLRRLRQVSEANDLATAVLLLLEDAQARAAHDGAGRGRHCRMGGALPRTIAEIERFLPPGRRCSMPLRTPFWWYRRRGVLASALSPLGAIYGRMAERKMAGVAPYRSRLPVICIGNFTAAAAARRRRRLPSPKC